MGGVGVGLFLGGHVSHGFASSVLFSTLLFLTFLTHSSVPLSSIFDPHLHVFHLHPSFSLPLPSVCSLLFLPICRADFSLSQCIVRFYFTRPCMHDKSQVKERERQVRNEGA